MDKSYLKYYCIIGLSCLLMLFTLQIRAFIPNRNLKSNTIEFYRLDCVSDGFNNSFWNNERSQAAVIDIDNNGTIHVVWQDNSFGTWGGSYPDSEIMYTSYKEGFGWSNITIISDGYNGYYWNDQVSTDPDISVDNSGTIHVVWQDNTNGVWGTDGEIMYVNYTDGLGWSNVTVISDGYLGYYWNDLGSNSPSIAVDNSGTIHVVWSDNSRGIWGGNGDPEIMYVSYTEGLGWSNATVISDGYNGYYWNDEFCDNPSISIDNSGNIHVVWEDYTVGIWGGGSDDSEIMYVFYTDGLGWSNATVISDGYNGYYWNDDLSGGANLAVDNNGTIHVVWYETTDGIWGADSECMYVNCKEGIGWANITVISDGYNGYYWNDGSSGGGCIAIDKNGTIHVVWSDLTEGIWGGGSDDQEIMYVYYTEREGWSNVSIVSDDETGWNNGNSYINDIAIDSEGNIYAIWEENTDGVWGNDSEIMFTSFIHTSFIISLKSDFTNTYLIISISILCCIAVFLFLDKDSKKKNKNFRKKILIYICNLSLATSLIILQTHQIDNNAKRGINLSKDPLNYLLPYILLIFALLILLLISLSLVISLQEYKSYLRMKNQEIISHRQLNLEKIFENKSRQKIIKTILSNPGIHFQELLRECQLQRGQLQWHLKVLLEYKIIKKKEIGQYISFFSRFDNVESVKYNQLFLKSEKRLEILDLVEEFPGITPSILANKLDLKMSTILYHIKKLENRNLINSQKEGRELKIHLADL